MVICIDLAIGSGNLYLRDKDPHIQPFLNYNYLEDDFDMARLREGVRLSLNFAEHRELGPSGEGASGAVGCGS